MNGPTSATEEDQTDVAGRRARGEFVRAASAHRAWIGDVDHPPEPGRYHLFVALNCPWCHRVTLARAVLGLADAITMDVAFPNRTGEDDPAGEGLWEFAPGRVATLTGAPLPGCTDETGTGRALRLAVEIYAREGSGEKSLPVLYDKRAGRIVSNESADIVRTLDRHARALGSSLPGRERPDLRPDGLVGEIDELNERVYADVNNGAYREHRQRSSARAVCRVHLIGDQLSDHHACPHVTR